MFRLAKPARLLLVGSMTAALAVTATAAAVTAEMDEALAEELVAIEQSKLDPWYGSASTEAYISHIAEDSTYFDPWAPGKLQGAEVIEYIGGFEGNIPNLAYEIVDPAADVRGDIVIFTFLIENSDPETGEPAGKWMVTNVLSPVDEGWEVIHTHYALPDTPPE